MQDPDDVGDEESCEDENDESSRSCLEELKGLLRRPRVGDRLNPGACAEENGKETLQFHSSRGSLRLYSPFF
jgi:hypothetical protein